MERKGSDRAYPFQVLMWSYRLSGLHDLLGFREQTRVMLRVHMGRPAVLRYVEQSPE